MAIASEPTSDRLRHRQVHAPVPDQFVIGTATLGNNHAAIFIWQTTERGANLFRNAIVEPFDIETVDQDSSKGTNTVPWTRVLRIAFAWAILLGLTVVTALCGIPGVYLSNLTGNGSLGG